MLDTPLNPGFEEVDGTDYLAIYSDDRMLDYMTEAEVVRIAAEFRNLWPSAPRHMNMLTASGTPHRHQTMHRTTPEGIPSMIASCLKHGEEPVLLRFDVTYLCYLEIIKGQDDWWWVMASTDAWGHYKCDQLPGLLALISHIAGESKI